MVVPKSTKQKLNTKNSTETEVVGASDYLPWTIWISNFMREQGYDIKQKIYYQDNMSAMKMEQNGISSTGEKSRHINIRYFFVKDVVKREKIDIMHCPTELMVADFFTKPLQGKIFRIMRDFIMRLSSHMDEERVEGTAKAETERNDSTGKEHVIEASMSQKNEDAENKVGKCTDGVVQTRRTYLEIVKGIA